MPSKKQWVFVGIIVGLFVLLIISPLIGFLVFLKSNQEKPRPYAPHINTSIPYYKVQKPIDHIILDYFMPIDPYASEDIVVDKNYSDKDLETLIRDIAVAGGRKKAFLIWKYNDKIFEKHFFMISFKEKSFAFKKNAKMSSLIVQIRFDETGKCKIIKTNGK